MKIKFVLSVLFLLIDLGHGAYQWPLKPFDRQHDVSATFCENRPSSDGSNPIDHFHNAIDIPLAEGGEVYAIESGSVVSITRTGYSAWIRVGRYNYLHVTPLASLSVNDHVDKGQLVGHTNYAGHIHLIDGYYPDYINPLRKDGIAPFEDSYLPTVGYVQFYKDGTTTQFTNNKVSGLVDIVSRLYDRTDNGPLGSNNGIYLAGYQIYDSSGTEALTQPIIPYQFDVRPSNDYIRNVYFKGSDLSTYIYILSNKITGNSYWDTRDYPPGQYQIKVFTGDTRDNRDEYWQKVKVVKQDVSPPAKPNVTSFTGQANGDWRLRWLPNDSSDVAGYEFYFSLTGTSFNLQNTISNALLPSDTSYIWNNFGYDYPLYVRLRAYDTAPITNYSAFSNTYVIKLSPDTASILIVDGFSRSDGYWQSGRHDFVRSYADMLLKHDLAFNSCSVGGLIGGQVDLKDYKTVFYFTGDDSTLSLQERELIREYLDSGGQLFLSGSNIVSGAIRCGDTAFVKEDLHVILVSDSATTAEIQTDSETGSVSQPFNHMAANDVITFLDPARDFIEYGNGSVAAIQFSGYTDSSARPAQLVFCAFPFELIEPAESRQILFDQALTFFGIPVTAIGSGPEVIIPKDLRLLMSYPNPFGPGTAGIHSSMTRIRYRIPIPPGKLLRVGLDIFDIRGKHIRSLMDQKQSAGQYEIVWNGRNGRGQPVSSGLYFCRFTYGTKSVFLKLILMR